MCDLERRPQLEYPGFSRNKILIQFRCIIFYMFLSFKFLTTIRSIFILKCTDLEEGSGGWGERGEYSHMKKMAATRVSRLETSYWYNFVVFYIFLSFKSFTTIRSMFILKCTDLLGKGKRTPIWKGGGSCHRSYKSGLGNSYRVVSLKKPSAESFVIPFRILNWKIITGDNVLFLNW